MRHRVVITGIGLVTPIGIGIEPFWNRLIAGHSGVDRIKSFDASGLRVRIAAEVDDFDPRQWLDYKDIRRFDRVGQLAVAAADMALAGQDLTGVDSHRIGCVVSSALGGPNTITEAVHGLALEDRPVSPLFLPMAMANFAASAVALRYGFGGPSYAPLSACASSADAVGQAYRLVRDGYVDACLAGGADALAPLVLSGFTSLRALSRRNAEPAAAARPFAADRDGFVLGEGAAVLLLEPLDSAARRGAHIYAEVCGYGQTNDTHHITAPQAEGAAMARAMALAMAEADVSSAQVDYINAHGTGTRLSDPAETAAIHRALGEHSVRVPISSTKPMTGHMLGAAGAVEAAICALSIERGVVPPTLNLHTPDPACDLDYLPHSARPARVAVALSNSMAFGGHNVTLTLRRLRAPATRSAAPRP